jgi:hypothetical protein
MPRYQMATVNSGCEDIPSISAMCLQLGRGSNHLRLVSAYVSRRAAPRDRAERDAVEPERRTNEFKDAHEDGSRCGIDHDCCVRH